MWTHCNSVQTVNYINSGLLLKHRRRCLTFTNYTSFSICDLKWQTFLWNTNIATSYEMGQVRLCDEDTTFCCVALKSIEKASLKNVTQQPPRFVGCGSCVCSLKLTELRQRSIIPFVCLNSVKMLFSLTD